MGEGARITFGPVWTARAEACADGSLGSCSCYYNITTLVSDTALRAYQTYLHTLPLRRIIKSIRA